ncbi:phage portal protein [Gordonibacter pamelaeae]|uniref:Phage portal protein, SPP1 Gp6-like n=1 Tax=Gordonibacter pamelaeae 7-10-1-b TaxID=657308 RepID=D6E9X7_9ACTN|nr:phage portal protein [Gordonibacter pamelaeae]CBL04524.1 Phage portal protein, SPP1 Gp6-like [Gordonibacter pamelaeae 7-10-1-b]
MNLNQLASVHGLPVAETGMLVELAKLRDAKLARNRVRDEYYRAHNRLRTLGIAIPPPLERVNAVVGWPAKAVDALAVRSRFDGFTLESGRSDALADVVVGNKLKILYSQAVTSELVSSCAFLTVSRGGAGEPPAVVSAYSAQNAAALWDRRRKRIRCGMTVVDVKRSPDGAEPEPTWVNLYTDTDVWEIRKAGAKWTSRRHPHEMGRPMMEPLVYRPMLDRPFGKSRISRAVMAITDSAVRESLRAEVSAEFFTSPQKYLLGADDTVFDKLSKWEAYIGNIFSVTPNEDGEIPKFGQLAQSTMQPHTEYKRDLAAAFSGETSIPVSEMGVVHDNPSSAEAIYACKESLVIEAESLNETNGAALREIGLMAMAAIRNVPLDQLTDEERSLSARFKNPAFPSFVSQADAIIKIVQAIPWMADSEVVLEELGFSEDQIKRLASDRAKAQGRDAIASLVAPKGVPGGDTAELA